MLRTSIRFTAWPFGQSVLEGHRHSPRVSEIDAHIGDLVLKTDQTSSLAFSGSTGAAILSFAGAALFCFTFGYNVGKPVIEAYTNADKKKEKNNED